MRSSVQAAKLAENRSDKREEVELANGLLRYAVQHYRDRFVTETALTAVPATIWLSDDMPPQSTWEVVVSAVAHCDADGSSAGFQRVCRFKRLAGAAVLLSTALPIGDTSDVGTWAVLLTNLANGVSLTVTGDATRVVEWSALVEIREA